MRLKLALSALLATLAFTPVQSQATPRSESANLGIASERVHYTGRRGYRDWDRSYYRHKHRHFHHRFYYRDYDRHHHRRHHYHRY